MYIDVYDTYRSPLPFAVYRRQAIQSDCGREGGEYTLYTNSMCVPRCIWYICKSPLPPAININHERWGAGVETQKYVRGDIGIWGRVPFNETYAPSLSTIYDGA